ncbi:MAG TPA: type II toxin-antitoxin system VapC family toxin [Solimonas sp.]|nr:type II toxin-antitoxin system VapC family toxin [Solimonas sp.]
MKRVLVDANVLLDVITDDPRWYGWSAAHLDACAATAELCINAIIYAEVSVGFERIEDLDRVLPLDAFVRLDLPWEAGFLAGKSFLRYRRAKGSRTSPLPDFYIGAHAAIEGMALLTRDPKRYRTYYPKLELICPL